MSPSGRDRVAILRRWDLDPPSGGLAVVIDVVRFSTTLCALLRAGRRRVFAAETPAALRSAPDLARSDVFSELKFDSPGRRRDNSPAQALESGRGRTAYALTTTGSPALWACRGARRVLAGCFADFDALLGLLRGWRGRIRLVPAAGTGLGPGLLEDELCAEALRAALLGRGGAAEEALTRIRASGRVEEFLRARPRSGQDLEHCLGLNGLPAVPEAFFPEGRGGPRLARIRKARA